MKLLGIDYGTVRIGLAVGDTDTKFAFPLRSIVVEHIDTAIAHIITIAQHEDVTAIVVGMPYVTDNSHTQGKIMQQVSNFIALLSKKTAIPIHTEDERFTSTLVERQHHESHDRQKGFDRDASAAAAILSTYIERHGDVS